MEDIGDSTLPLNLNSEDLQQIQMKIITTNEGAPESFRPHLVIQGKAFNQASLEEDQKAILERVQQSHSPQLIKYYTALKKSRNQGTYEKGLQTFTIRPGQQPLKKRP